MMSQKPLCCTEKSKLNNFLDLHESMIEATVLDQKWVPFGYSWCCWCWISLQILGEKYRQKKDGDFGIHQYCLSTRGVPPFLVKKNMGVSKNNGTPQIIHFNRVFHYKPSILRYPYFWKHPYHFSLAKRPE